MIYLKNIEVARLYRVSPTSINRWIKKAKVKQNNLHIGQDNGKEMIIDSQHNRLELHRLSNGGKKYLAGRDQKKITPKKEFYSLFSQDQIVEIINALETDMYLSHKFAYLGDGARIWDIFQTIETASGVYYAPEGHLLKINLPNVFNFLQSNKFNYIEIGPGNGAVTLDFVKGLAESGKMLSYTAIDISQEMLNLLEINMNPHFDGMDITQNYIQGDIENMDVRSVFYKLKKGEGEEKVSNIIIVTGGLIGAINLGKTLEGLRPAMGKEDILILENAIDNPDRRGAFDHILKTMLGQNMLALIRYLNIDVDACEMYGVYDEVTQARLIKLKIDKNYNLEVVLDDVKKTIYLVKGIDITICRLRSTKIDEISSYLRTHGLEITHLSTDTSFKSKYSDTVVMFTRRISDFS